jgi:methyl-accepting chemotaxis protein
MGDYNRELMAELTFWSVDPDLLENQEQLVEDWRLLARLYDDPGDVLQLLYVQENPHPAHRRHELDDAGDGSVYSEQHARLHPLAELFVTERGDGSVRFGLRGSRGRRVLIAVSACRTYLRPRL